MKFSSFAVAAALSLASLASQAATTVYANNLITGGVSFNSIPNPLGLLGKPVGYFKHDYDYTFDLSDFPTPEGALSYSFSEFFKGKALALAATDIDFTGYEIKVIDANSNVVWHDTPVAPGALVADVMSFTDVTVSTRTFTISVEGVVEGNGSRPGVYPLHLRLRLCPSPSLTPWPCRVWPWLVCS
jgi:hypothetical protein